MSKDQAGRRILVGVTYGQPDTVLRHAARFARVFGASLVCAHVDPGRYVVEERPDGTVVSLPLDPELPELKDTDFDQGLVAQVRAAVADDSLDLSFRELAGDVAYALTRLAEPYREAVTMFTEELEWLTAEDKAWIMGRGLCEWIGWTSA